MPQNIPGGEIYQALEKGTIDAAEWVGPYDDEKLGFNKVAQYYYYPGWWEGGPQLTLYINSKAWDDTAGGVQGDRRSRRCASRTRDMLAKYDAHNPAALKRWSAAAHSCSVPEGRDGRGVQGGE